MINQLNRLTLLICCTLALFSCNQQKNFTKEELSLVPLPQRLELQKGSFNFNASTQFLVENPDQKEIALLLAEKFKTAAGWSPEIKTGTKSSSKNTVVFTTTPSLPKEGYQLEVTPKQINIKAAKPAGFFYAMQSIRQLLPTQIESKTMVKGIKWLVPAVKISDAPRFPWRGFMQDVSRHFLPKEYIKELIDNLAMYKMNTFHWHLVDDQGWRIEIKKYPKLTEVGAWRVDHEDKHWNSRPKQQKGEKATYGGFYTQEDIREIVDYAQKRFVTIVPEIEMPAHTTCALAAYPEYSCSGGPFTVPSGGLWPITDIYCAGNDKTFDFLEDVLTEVMDLFPSIYIHIGGDEANKSEWKKCKKCHARMRKEGLKTEHELQSYFIKRIEKFINSKGRRLIGWDEILEGGLAPQATVMSWRGFKGGLEAAKQGHDVVMTPGSHCYFDHYQGPQDQEPLAWGGYLPLKQVYSFDPVHESMDTKAAAHVLGGQANLWAEYVPTVEQAQYMTFPRLAALAESVWTPKERKEWNQFAQRMLTQFERYQLMGINYAKSAFLVSFSTEFDKQEKQLTVSMQSEFPDITIHYTLDGTEPQNDSPVFTTPIVLDHSVTLKAVTYLSGKKIGKEVSQNFNIHKATSKPVKYVTSPQKKYMGAGEISLVNSIHGTKNFSDGNWQGWHGNNMEVIIDLQKQTPIHKITLGALQSTGSWIFLPKKMMCYTSNDGKKFSKYGEVSHNISPLKGETILYNFTVEAKEINTRYIKVIAQNFGTCPKQHMGAGDPAYLFVDEIEVE